MKLQEEGKVLWGRVQALASDIDYFLIEVAKLEDEVEIYRTGKTPFYMEEEVFEVKRVLTWKDTLSLIKEETME